MKFVAVSYVLRMHFLFLSSLLYRFVSVCHRSFFFLLYHFLIALLHTHTQTTSMTYTLDSGLNSCFCVLFYCKQASPFLSINPSLSLSIVLLLSAVLAPTTTSAGRLITHDGIVQRPLSSTTVASLFARRDFP